MKLKTIPYSLLFLVSLFNCTQKHETKEMEPLQVKQDYSKISKGNNNHMLFEIKKLHQASGEYLVYIKIKEGNLCNEVSIRSTAISSDSIGLNLAEDIDLKTESPVKTGQGKVAFISGPIDEKLNSFKINYTPLSTILKSFTNEFYKTNNFNGDWNIDEIGYTAINDEKQPWRWAVTLINKADSNQGKKSFLLEKGKWVLQKNAEIKYFFAKFLSPRLLHR